MSHRRDLGTDDPRVKVRPGKSKPRRSKKKVDYSDSPQGFVYALDRGRYHVELDQVSSISTTEKTRITCVKARELGRHAIVVGDRVRVQGDLSGRKDTLARLVEVLPRKNELRRSAEDSLGAKEKPMVANVDQLVIVAACADPVPKPGMIDRCLVAAYVTGMKPLLVLTKSDLVSATPLLDTFAPLGLDYVVTSAEKGSGIEELSEKLSQRISVLVGHSGVGKSTLINALIPQAGRKTGQVNQVTGKGRHTSTSSMAFPYREGWIIDTPGIRSFGLAHIELEDIFGAFPDLKEIIEYCPKACLHQPDSVGCALPRWAKTDLQKQKRLASLYRLILSHHRQYQVKATEL